MNYNRIEYEASFGTANQLPEGAIAEIAFSGRSNVGKSSLINKLFNRKNLARVSSVPGKTTTVNFYKTDTVRFVDLPGYGFAKRPEAEKLRWAELMEGYFTSCRPISVVIQLLDMRHTPSADDMTMLDYLDSSGIPYVIVMTKCDKLNKSELTARREALKAELADRKSEAVIEFSAVTGTGVNELKSIIEKHL